jgi:hypothetical protein
MLWLLVAAVLVSLVTVAVAVRVATYIAATFRSSQVPSTPLWSGVAEFRRKMPTITPTGVALVRPLAATLPPVALAALMAAEPAGHLAEAARVALHRAPQFLIQQPGMLPATMVALDLAEASKPTGQAVAVVVLVVQAVTRRHPVQPRQP